MPFSCPAGFQKLGCSTKLFVEWAVGSDGSTGERTRTPWYPARQFQEAVGIREVRGSVGGVAVLKSGDVPGKGEMQPIS